MSDPTTADLIARLESAEEPTRGLFGEAFMAAAKGLIEALVRRAKTNPKESQQAPSLASQKFAQ